MIATAEKEWVDSMYMTSREKTIIELLIKTGGRHTPMSMANYLQVSVRTIDRELKKIEKMVSRFGLKLERMGNDSVEIKGPDQAVFKLAQALSEVEPLDLSVKERRLLLLLQLMQAREPVKTSALALDLNISVTTLMSYLDQLTDWLKDFDVAIVRKRGVGVTLSGYERSKRRALGNFFLLYFNEELIRSIFSLDHFDAASDRRILHYFKSRYLHDIDQVIRDHMSSMPAELADSDYVGFMIQVCITVQRFQDGFSLTAEEDKGGAASHLFIDTLCDVLATRLGVTLPAAERNYLDDILKGSRLQHADSVYYDQAITGREIKELIQHVSKAMQVDLTGDFSLFQGLMAHLEPSLFRIRKNIPSANPLTRQVKHQFPGLFKVTADCLKRVFSKIDFPDDEVAYVVLHFGSALEQRKQTVRLRALVVCPTGIGASKMLAMRLRKEIQELSSVTVSSISDMEKMDLNHFDLILSTVLLPKQKIPCITVNPLLSRENIDDIRALASELISRRKAVPRAFTGRASKEIRRYRGKPERSLGQFLNEMDKARTGVKDILDSFTVVPVTDAGSMEQVIRIMSDQAARLALTDHPDSVSGKLLKREKAAGLAIPDTRMALFHCRDRSIRHIAFLIGHTDHPFRLRGMDDSRVDVTEFLILLAPEPLDVILQEVISMISSSLVEDEEGILVFSSANAKMIRAKLEDIFYRFLKNKFSKG